jgi:hypothetical protein
LDALHIAILALVVVALNLPFGAYRATTRRFSARWFLAVHLPIALVLLLRVASGYSYRVVPWFVVAAVVGQLLGSWGYQRLRAARAVTPAVVPVTQDDAPDIYPS